MSVSVELLVQGELRPDQLDGIIPLIQQATDGQGTASAVGKTLTWSSRTDSNTSAQQVLVASRDGTTLIRVEERFTGLAGGLFGGIVGGVGVGGGVGFGGAIAGIAGSVVLGFALPITVIGGSYLAARSIFTRIVRNHQVAAISLSDQIAEYVRAEGNLTETTAGLPGSDPDLPRLEG
jgi:predicted lipid-binding transport protein (Tim44 family)